MVKTLGVCLGAALVLCAAPAGFAHPPAREAGPSIQDLAALVELGDYGGGLALSPDGTQLALFERRVDLERDDYAYRLIVIPAAGGAAHEIGDGGGIILVSTDGRRSGLALDRAPRWSPDNHWLAYLAEREGRVEIWRSSADGRTRERIAAPPGDPTALAWLDADTIVFARRPERTALAAAAAYAMRHGFRVDERVEPVYALAPMPDDTRSYWRLALSTGEITPASAADQEALNATGPAAIGPVPGAADVSDPPLALFTTDASGERRQCMSPLCTGMLRGVAARGDGDVVFQRLEGFNAAETALYLWSPTSDEVRRIRAAEDRLVGCQSARGAVFCLQEASASPRRVVAIDPTTGAMRVLHDPNPSWDAAALPRIERLDFTDRAGIPSYAHLVYPRGYRRGRAYPMVIVQYRSRGFLRAGIGDEHPIFPLSARGYFVLSVERPDDRVAASRASASDFPRDQELNGEERRMKLDALAHFIETVVARGLVDERRIAITGMSDGAETLFWALEQFPFAAAVASTPPTDPSFWTLQSTRSRLYLRRHLNMEPPWTQAERPWGQWWARNTFAAAPERFSTPILLNLSASEAMTAFPFIERMREQRVPVEAYLYPGAYHLKWRPTQILAAQARGIAWIDFWLRDTIAADDTDSDRATRWRAMRAAR